MLLKPKHYMKKLNIGCGKDKLEGYINLDISREVEPDIVCDIRHGLPFPDDYFDEVVAYNVLTQIDKEFLFVMNELHRVTKGSIYVRIPIVPNECAWQDPMDCRRFTSETFTYIEYGHRRYEQYGKHYGFLPFKVEVLEKKEQWKIKLTPKK